MTGPLAKRSDGVFLSVRVTPKSSADVITGFHVGADGQVSLAVKVTAAPDKGRANSAVIELLARWLGCPKSSLELVRGETDRHKQFRLAGGGAGVEQAVERLKQEKEDSHGKADRR